MNHYSFMQYFLTCRYPYSRFSIGQSNDLKPIARNEKTIGDHAGRDFKWNANICNMLTPSRENHMKEGVHRQLKTF
jgi:hypothetical protein